MCCLLLGLIGFPMMARAQATSPNADAPAAEAAVEALGDFPWYDAATGELRRLDVKPPGDLKNRNSKWLFKAPNWSIPDWVFLLLRILAWATLVLLVIAIVIFMVKAFVGIEDGFTERGRASDDLSLGGDVDRVDALPFQLKGPRGDLLAEARRLFDEGRYAEAMVYLYSYQLVQLDKSHVIRLTRGKTNRQYLREIRRQSNLYDLMRQSVETFEDVFFGDHPLDRRGFEACWTRLDEFHHQLGPEHAFA